MPLTLAQRDAFYRDGFVIAEQLFTPAEVAIMAAAFDRAHAAGEAAAAALPAGQYNLELRGARVSYEPGPDQRPAGIRHISMVGNLEPELLRLGGDPRLLDLALPLLGSPAARQMINQAHYKRPGTGVAFAWHQDSRHRGVDSGRFVDVNGRGSYVQIAIALDAATPDNGPLSFIQGSPALGHLDHGGIPPAKLDLARQVTPLLRAGDAVLFGPYTIHGSQANTSPRWRRVFINGFAHPDAIRFTPALPHEGRTLPG
jgi:hypothetical protein